MGLMRTSCWKLFLFELVPALVMYVFNVQYLVFLCVIF